MGCEEFRKDLMEWAEAAAPPPHARECPACAQELASLRQTMALLDEWQAPEPSAYFDTRLRAALRAEAAAPRGWRAQFSRWFSQARVPLAAGALAIAALVGVSIYHPQPGGSQHAAVRVSAVKDLQTLDTNYDLLEDLDALDNSAAQVNDPGL